VSTGFQYDVFLSHNAKDKPRVRKLAERLKAAGLRVWFDEWIVRPGDMIAPKVDEGLEQSRVLLLCISPTALASGWVALERSTAIHRDPANEGRRFVPLLLEECKLPDTLRRYKYVDFRGDNETAFAELLVPCRAQKSETPPIAISTSTEIAAKQLEPLAVLERDFSAHKGYIRSVAVSNDAKWMASGSDDNTIKIWELDTGKRQTTLEGHPTGVLSVAITPDGSRVLSGSFDKSVRVWDTASGRELAKLGGHTAAARSVVALSDNARALSGGFDKTLRLWDLASRSCLRVIRCGTDDGDEIGHCTVNSAGNHALSGHRNGQIRIWSLESGECLATLKGHSELVRSIQITLDGQYAVSASKDRTVKVWDVEAERCIGTLEGHETNVLCAAISPDNSLVASSGFSDRAVRLWDWKTGTCVQIISEGWHKFTPTSVTFSPDGSRLVLGTGDEDGRICIYRIADVRPTPSVEAARRYVNAKVVLIGEGTAGKTSLAHRLIEDKYVVRDRTHGMNVWRLELPLPVDATLEREALLWDLAGQEDYRLIHQLFLEETAMALLLINPQKDDLFAEAGDWLKALRTAAGKHASRREPARLLIFSQIDVGGMKLSNAKIERFRKQHDFANWLPTSAKTGENCSDHGNQGQPSRLKRLIAESIPWDKLPWTSTPRLLSELKNAVMEMRDKTEIRLLRFSELRQRLEQALRVERFGEADVRTAVTLLANHGLARALKFGDLVLLRPDLLNGYAAAIIRSARAHSDEIGCVLEANIYSPDFDFTGVERLKHRPQQFSL